MFFWKKYGWSKEIYRLIITTFVHQHFLKPALLYMFQWWHICEGYQIRHLGILQPADEHLFFPCDFPANLRDGVRLAQKNAKPLRFKHCTAHFLMDWKSPFWFHILCQARFTDMSEYLFVALPFAEPFKSSFQNSSNKSSTPKSHPGWKGCAKSWSSKETCLNWAYRLNTAKKIYRRSLFRSKGH